MTRGTGRFGRNVVVFRQNQIIHRSLPYIFVETGARLRSTLMSFFRRFVPISSIGSDANRVPSISPTITSTEQNPRGNNFTDPCKPSGKEDWTVIFPEIGLAIATWADKANASVRQHASTCCSGDLFGPDDGELVPGMIVIQTDSIVGEKATDIELMPVSTFDDDLVGITVDSKSTDSLWKATQYQKCHTVWNEIPDDPVDEVSLKGSSFYCSSSDEDYSKNGKSRSFPMEDFHQTI